MTKSKFDAHSDEMNLSKFSLKTFGTNLVDSEVKY